MATIPGPPPSDGDRIGEVRDGYRWTGTEWVPSVSTYPAGSHRDDPYDKDDDDKRKLATALGILAALVLLGLLIWWIVDQNNDDDEDQPAVEPTPIASIGTAVQDGDIRFTVTNVTPDVEAVGSGADAVIADGSFTLVSVTAQNTGNDPVGFSSENIDAVDTEGRNLDADGDAYGYTVNGAPGYDGDIAANATVTTIVAFDVADDATLDKVVVHEPENSDGQEIDVS